MWTGKYIALACLVLAGSGISRAQSPKPRDSWMMQNYRFTGPPPAGSVEPVSPVVSQLREIQNALLSILRKADYMEDYEAALAAAEQATATALLLESTTKRIEPAAKTGEVDPSAGASTPLYVFAFKDRTIELAACYWTDELMLHYMTRQGAHVQVRLNLLDRELTMKLNRGRNPDFRLPD